MTYSPILFATIAREVAAPSGFAEQYMIATEGGGITTMFSTHNVDGAIDAACKALGDPIAVVRAEFNMTLKNCSPFFADGAIGVLEVNEILVEVSVRELRPGTFRLLFSRVDAMKLYSDLSTRVARLESVTVTG